jgi:hypothetical protein
MKTSILGLSIALCACAAPQHVNLASRKLLLQEKAPGVFVGHSETGEVVIAASHYDAMNGVAVADVDLGLAPNKSGSGGMLCRREVPTGSHVPHWFCRYTEDMAAERQFTLNMLQQPMLSPNVQSGGMAVGAGHGSAGRNQQR